MGFRLQRIESPPPDDRPVPMRYTEAMAFCAEFCRLAASGERYEHLYLPLKDAIAALEAIYGERRAEAIEIEMIPPVLFRRAGVQSATPTSPAEPATPWWQFWRTKRDKH